MRDAPTAGGRRERRSGRGSASLPTEGRRRRLLVRVVFAVVLLFFAAQLVLTEGHREPYPALFQPSFGDGSVTPEGTVRRPQARVTAVFADGTTASFGHTAVMAQSMSSPWRVLRSAFGPDSPRRNRPQTVAWLEHRLFELTGRHPQSAVVEWSDVAYDINDERPPQSTVTDRYEILFGGERG